MKYHTHRQGDILLVPVALTALDGAIPEARDARGRLVLAHGEVTGHAHAVLDREAEIVRNPQTNVRFLRIMAASGVSLIHEEHGAQTLTAPAYEIRHKREYVPKAVPRRVVD